MDRLRALWTVVGHVRVLIQNARTVVQGAVGEVKPRGTFGCHFFASLLDVLRTGKGVLRAKTGLLVRI